MVASVKVHPNLRRRSGKVLKRTCRMEYIVAIFGKMTQYDTEGPRCYPHGAYDLVGMAVRR